ncbi:MAG: glycosyltransferase family 39 protein [Cyanobium sp.]
MRTSLLLHRSESTSLSSWSRHAQTFPSVALIGLLSALWLGLICWLAFFNRLGALGLMDKTEALFVEVGHQMLVRGDWVTPWWNGQLFFDYPVWGYWMVALSFRLFGVSEWAARLPVALAASAVVVASFLLLRQLAPAAEATGRRWLRAAVGAGIMATTPGWIGWGRSSTTDMFLSSAITLALYGFLLAHHAPASGRQARFGRGAMALFAGIAVLAKGPVGLLLPALVVSGHLILTGEWRRWWRPGSLLAMATLFLGVVLPWYVAAAQRHGEAFLGGFLGFSNLQRFTNVLYDHPGPPWFYLPWVAVLLLPWSLFLPAAVMRLHPWRLRSWRRDPGTTLPLFFLLWLVLVVAFFSAAATKLPGYILPAIPAAAMVIALYWRPIGSSALEEALANGAGGLNERNGWLESGSSWVAAALLALLAVAAGLSPRWAATDPAHPGFGQALARSGLPLTLALILAAMALAMALLLGRGPRGQRWLWAPGLAGFLAILALVIAPLAPLLDRERQLPLRQIAAEARRLALPREPLWVVGTRRYSMVFYAGENASFVANRRSLRRQQRQDPAALGMAADTVSVRLVGDRTDLEALELPDAAISRLARRDQQELWRVSLSSLPGPR